MTEIEKKFLKICENLKNYVTPYKTNIEKIRVGNKYDGGYVIGELSKYDYLYSYGCNDMISFENEIYNRYKIPSYVYDHTTDKITDKPDYVNFFREGVSYEKTDDMDTIDNHVIKNGHTQNKNLMMQIDIEGGEWNLFKRCKYLTNFSQIVIEFHIFQSLFNYEKVFEDTFTTLNRDFTCIHVHGTNCPLQPWLDGNFPKVFEVSYIRNDFITEKEIEPNPYPVKGLDFPTDPTRADLKLDYWIKN